MMGINLWVYDTNKLSQIMSCIIEVFKKRSGVKKANDVGQHFRGVITGNCGERIRSVFLSILFNDFISS